MRLASALLAAVLSGVLYGLAFPPLSWGPLAFVALVPFLVGLRGLSVGQTLLSGFLLGLTGSFFTARALPLALESYFLQPRWVGWALAIWVYSFTVSVYVAAFALAYRRLVRFPGPAQSLLAAAAWVALELLRARHPASLFIGNPWALTGYSQVGFDAFVQVASLTGIYGVSFAVVAVNAALAQLWVGWRRDEAGPGRPAWVLAAGLLPAVAALLFGVATLRGADDRQEPGFVVAVVQANLDPGARWEPEAYGKNLDGHLRLTLQAIDDAQPVEVFWPESAMTFHLAEEPVFRRTIARVLAEGNTELVASGPWEVKADEPLYTNSVFVLDPQANVLGRYDKRHLVPFAEFTPFGSVDLIRRNFGRARVYTPGWATAPLGTRVGAAGVVICNEAYYSEIAARRARDGATYLFNPSNDTWIVDDAMPRMAQQMAIIRAVEQRRYLVRASTSGPSAIVDPWGRVQIESAPRSAAVIAGVIRPRSDLTIYARVGDLFAFLCLGALALGLLLAGRSSTWGASAGSQSDRASG